MDENPYEPPTTLASNRSRATKRRVGVGAILLLTPLAVAVAHAGSCGAARVLHIEPLGLSAMVPLVVLTGLMIWATVVDRHRPGDATSRPSRTKLFLLTPLVVFLAAVLGFGIGAAVVHVVSTAEGGLSETSMLLGAIAFWTLPTIALITMLFIAWKAGRN